jgi:TRAP-type C4-dicarboxylate transport system permease small subunit
LLKGKLKKYYIQFGINIIFIASALLIIVYGFEFAFKYGFIRVSPTFLTPMFYVFVIIPISGILMLIFAVYNLVFGMPEELLGKDEIDSSCLKESI